MKNYFAIILLGFFTLLFSCTEVEEDVSTEQLLKEIQEAILQEPEQDDKITFWKKMLNQERYASDNVAKARINYHIARNFAPVNMDSAEIYTIKAITLLEDVEEKFESEKILLYNGLGNVAQSKGKDFLASFYYHKIVSILDANPSDFTVTAKNKIRFYLHSAQSNTQIGLHESAFELNKKAETYIDSLSNDDDLRWRVYKQLFSSMYHAISNATNNATNNTDSLFYYLEKIKQNLHSDESNRSYYYGKAQFLELTNQYDSARIYFQKALKMDQNELKDIPITPANIYTTYCALLQNSIERGKMNEVDSMISILSELEKDTSLYLSPTDYLYFWRVMMTYHYQTGDFDKYQEVTETVLKLKDQIQKEAELQAKEEMHTMYQLEENKKSIKKLNQSVEVTENQLQKTEYFLAITILAILVIIAILAILYYRQKSQKLQQEYEKVVLEQKLLRTQMEPHFIFNTLSTLQSLIRFQEPKKAIDYLNLFSRLLRSNLELSRQDIISLEDEIESLHNYLQLQQARFKDYFTYQIQIPTDLEIDALFIPPMLIQPFVENSILHGFEGEQAWNIEIKITELAPTNQLQIEIIDNGIGINPTLKKKKKSISGDIAKERLEILAKKYKIPTDYQIFSEKGKGTKVVIKLPIIDGFKQD